MQTRFGTILKAEAKPKEDKRERDKFVQTANRKTGDNSHSEDYTRQKEKFKSNRIKLKKIKRGEVKIKLIRSEINNK